MDSDAGSEATADTVAMACGSAPPSGLLSSPTTTEGSQLKHVLSTFGAIVMRAAHASPTSNTQWDDIQQDWTSLKGSPVMAETRSISTILSELFDTVRTQSTTASYDRIGHARHDSIISVATNPSEATVNFNLEDETISEEGNDSSGSSSSRASPPVFSPEKQPAKSSLLVRDRPRRNSHGNSGCSTPQPASATATPSSSALFTGLDAGAPATPTGPNPPDSARSSSPDMFVPDLAAAEAAQAEAGGSGSGSVLLDGSGSGSRGGSGIGGWAGEPLDADAEKKPLGASVGGAAGGAAAMIAGAGTVCRTPDTASSTPPPGPTKNLVGRRDRRVSFISSVGKIFPNNSFSSKTDDGASAASGGGQQRPPVSPLDDLSTGSDAPAPGGAGAAAATAAAAVAFRESPAPRRLVNLSSLHLPCSVTDVADSTATTSAAAVPPLPPPPASSQGAAGASSASPTTPSPKERSGVLEVSSLTTEPQDEQTGPFDAMGGSTGSTAVALSPAGPQPMQAGAAAHQQQQHAVLHANPAGARNRESLLHRRNSVASVVSTATTMSAVDRGYDSEDECEDMLSHTVTETREVRKETDDLGNKYINNYAVICEIGRGSFGKVKEAQHIETGKTYAIKVLNKSLLRRKSASTLRLAQQEVAILKKLRHKNIVTLYEVIDDEESNKMYMVLEYAGGGCALTISDQEGEVVGDPLDLDTAQKYFRDLVSALRYSHRNNIIHRDIKPENLLLDMEGNLKLSDFGVSAVVSKEDWKLHDLEGTPAFLAPEALDIRKATAGVCGRMVDMWALGVTLYSFVYGRLPFFGKTRGEMVKSILTDEPTLHVEGGLQEVVEDSCQEVISELLQKDPEVRCDMDWLVQHEWVNGVGLAHRNGVPLTPLCGTARHSISYGGTPAGVSFMDRGSMPVGLPSDSFSIGSPTIATNASPTTTNSPPASRRRMGGYGAEGGPPTPPTPTKASSLFASPTGRRSRSKSVVQVSLEDIQNSILKGSRISLLEKVKVTRRMSFKGVGMGLRNPSYCVVPEIYSKGLNAVTLAACVVVSAIADRITKVLSATDTAAASGGSGAELAQMLLVKVESSSQTETSIPPDQTTDFIMKTPSLSTEPEESAELNWSCRSAAAAGGGGQQASSSGGGGGGGIFNGNASTGSLLNNHSFSRRAAAAAATASSTAAAAAAAAAAMGSASADDDARDGLGMSWSNLGGSMRGTAAVFKSTASATGAGACGGGGGGGGGAATSGTGSDPPKSPLACLPGTPKASYHKSKTRMTLNPLTDDGREDFAASQGAGSPCRTVRYATLWSSPRRHRTKTMVDPASTGGAGGAGGSLDADGKKRRNFFIPASPLGGTHSMAGSGSFSRHETPSEHALGSGLSHCSEDSGLSSPSGRAPPSYQPREVSPSASPNGSPSGSPTAASVGSDSSGTARRRRAATTVTVRTPEEVMR